VRSSIFFIVLLCASAALGAECPRCATAVGDTHNYCFHCGFPLRDLFKDMVEGGRVSAQKARERAGPVRKIPEGPDASVLSHDRRTGWFWVDKGKKDGIQWGQFYTVYHHNNWKAMMRVRNVTEERSRCKLILGSLSDVKEGYRIVPFENIAYEVVSRAPERYVGDPVVWYGRLANQEKRGKFTYLHVASTWQDNYRELKETFGRAKGLFRTYKVKSQARNMVESCIAKGSFLAEFRGSLSSIDPNSKMSNRFLH